MRLEVRTRARAVVAIIDWVADLPASVAEHLDTVARSPSEYTIRRRSSRVPDAMKERGLAPRGPPG